MKHVVFTILFILFMKLNVFAYSSEDIFKFEQMLATLSEINVDEQTVRYRMPDDSLFTDLRTIVKASNSIAIAVNRKKNNMTIYAYNENDNCFNVPIVAFPVTTNPIKTRLGIYEIGKEKHKWKLMHEGCWTMFAIRVYKGIMIHSVLYRSNKEDSFQAYTYNGLVKNTAVSEGCIRLATGDAKWLCESICEQTPLVIYDSDYDGPFERPRYPEIDKNSKKDPTYIG